MLSISIYYREIPILQWRYRRIEILLESLSIVKKWSEISQLYIMYMRHFSPTSQHSSVGLIKLPGESQTPRQEETRRKESLRDWKIARRDAANCVIADEITRHNYRHLNNCERLVIVPAWLLARTDGNRSWVVKWK